MAVVFKYEKQQYQNKQDDLKELNDELKDLLIEFQDKKLQMVEFWDDDQADHYRDILDKNISACKTAIYNTDLTIKQVQSDIDEMGNNENLVEGLMEEALQVVSTLQGL